MRNRFRPNVTPRGSRHSEPSSVSLNSSSTSSTVSEPVETQTEEEPAVFIPPNSARAEVSIEVTELNSTSLEEVEVTSQQPISSTPKETKSNTRRSRIKPSITPITRTRNKPTNRGTKTIPQEANEVSKAIPEISPVEGEEVSTTVAVKKVDTPPPKDKSTIINREQPPEPAPKTPEQNTQPETPNQLSKQAGNSAVLGEGNAASPGSLLSRRKRAIPNIGAAARRRSSVLVPVLDKGTNQSESSVIQQDEEIHDKNISESNETEERSSKKPRTAPEVLDSNIGVIEITVQADKETQNQSESVEEVEQITIRKIEERKRKSTRHSRPKEPLDPSKMTLQDLIYFNPKANPMKSSIQAKRRKLSNKRPTGPSTESENGDGSTMEVDGLDFTDQPNPTTEQQSGEDSLAAETSTPQEGNDSLATDTSTTQEDKVCAPQVKIGADGCIILDEESLVIRSPEKSTLDKSDIVYEDSNNLNYTAYLKQTKRTKWSMQETLKFYRALSQVGTDFSLMLPLFPKRKRNELKAKFKREDKHHQDLVDRVLVHRTPITIEMFARKEETEEDVLNEILSGNDKNTNTT